MRQAHRFKLGLNVGVGTREKFKGGVAVNEKALRKYLQAKLALQETLETHPRIHDLLRREARLLRGDATALAREEGQGMLEYVILLAVVFAIAAAVIALGHSIRAKYQDAGNAVQGIQIEAP